MIEIKLKNGNEEKIVNIPNGWDEITINDYIKLVQVPNDKLSTSQIVVKNLSILTGIDEDELYDLPMELFNDLIPHLTLFNEDIKGENVEYVELEGDKYYLKRDFEKLSLGETISIDTITEKYNGNVDLAIKELLCIFLRRKDENGNLEKFKNEFMDRSEMFGTISITKVKDLFNFFLTGNQ